MADLDSEEMPGTKKNPMPGATRDEIDEARKKWAARDNLSQEERNRMNPESIGVLAKSRSKRPSAEDWIAKLKEKSRG